MGGGEVEGGGGKVEGSYIWNICDKKVGSEAMGQSLVVGIRVRVESRFIYHLLTFWIH